MATSTTTKLALGQLIIAAMSAVTSQITKAARDAFTKVYNAMVDAEAAVKAADAALDAATQRAQAADEAQDRATLELATKLSGDGFGRLNPFKAFGAVNPSRLVNLGHVLEANVLIRLAADVLAHPDSSAATKKAAAAVDRSANAMKAAENERLKAFKRRGEAIDRRDGELPKSFAAALTNLRSSVKFADYQDKTEHYAAVFGGLQKAPKKKKKASPAPNGPVS